MAEEKKIDQDLSQVGNSIQDNTPSSPSKFRKILEKLYLLAELKPGKTLSVRTMTIIDHDTFNSWCRWWYNEDRFKSLDAVYSIIDEAKSYLDSLNDEEFYEQKKTLIGALYSARDGIASLGETYREDSRVKARVNAIIAEIKSIFLKQEKPLLNKWPYFAPTIGAITRITRSPIKAEFRKKAETEDNFSVD